MAILTALPTIFLYFISITNYELGSKLSDVKIVGLENYARLLSGGDPEFWVSLKLSLTFMVIVTTIELILGFFTATLLNRDFKLKSVAFACLIVPIIMTPSIVGQMWKLMLNSEYGVINYIFGIHVTWLGPEFAFISTIIIDLWEWTPFMALLIYAGLTSIPSEPHESAVVDGANRIQLLRFVTLPLLKPLLLLAVIFRSIDSFRLFDIPFVLTQGGPGSATELLSLHVYRLGFAMTGWIGRASACAVILLIITIIITQTLIRYFRKGSE